MFSAPISLKLPPEPFVPHAPEDVKPKEQLIVVPAATGTELVAGVGLGEGDAECEGDGF
jgi:hypothetical protein